MSEFLRGIQNVGNDAIRNDEEIPKNTFWHLFSYARGLEYALENLGKLGEVAIKAQSLGSPDEASGD